MFIPSLRISYKDDGTGFEEKKGNNSIGLKSIKYRISILNADIDIKSDKGLKMEIRIPVEL